MSHDLGHVGDVPLGKRFESEQAPMLSVPLVGRAALRVLSTFPKIEDIPVVFGLVIPKPPVRRARDDQVDSFRGDLADEIERVSLNEGNSRLTRQDSFQICTHGHSGEYIAKPGFRQLSVDPQSQQDDSTPLWEKGAMRFRSSSAEIPPGPGSLPGGFGRRCGTAPHLHQPPGEGAPESISLRDAAARLRTQSQYDRSYSCLRGEVLNGGASYSAEGVHNRQFRRRMVWSPGLAGRGPVRDRPG